MPLDEKQKEKLMIGGVVLAIVGLYVALKSGASSTAGQSLAGNRSPTPGGPGYNPNSAANDLGKAYLDYQFKEQQLTAQQANFQAQLASTDARAALNANTQVQIAKIGASSRLDSSLVGPATGLIGKALDKFVPNATTGSNPNANGTNNSLPVPGPTGPYSGNILDADNPDAPKPYRANVDQNGYPLTNAGANTLAKSDQVFGPPSAPATPDAGYPSISGLVGDKSYQTTPILDFLTGATYDIPYESPGSVSPVGGSVGYSDYFSAPSNFNPSFPSLGYDYGGTPVADMGNGGSPDSGSNDVGYEG